MKIGTKSLLFGVHQFAWHPITVYLAWCRLYGLPGWREIVCIVVHDWGYWGCSDMDGEHGKNHPFLGARIARRFFGHEYFYLVLCHSRSLANVIGREPSKLCWADKLSMIYDPWIFYGPRAWITGELAEYMANARRSNFIDESESAETWHRRLVVKLSAVAAEKSKQLKEVLT